MSEDLYTSFSPGEAVVNGCFIEIYDDGVVLTGRGVELTISNCHLISRPGEEMPKLSSGQIAARVPPEPPREWTAEDWEDFLEEFGDNSGV